MSVAVIDRNTVVLRGRMSAPAELTSLPSGDTLVSFRIVVRRPEPRARGQSVDVLTCITYDRALQRRVAAWEAGEVIEVEGALQRRFWRTPGGTASVCEVNCRRGRKVPRASGATKAPRAERTGQSR
ncbi:single-stranded DNA-binding protein [Geodermatophilus ruber]|uniref:Single-strand DNA-binding protein n=1 Tax=Geodermatophilus ruber TaxID=504800 RepID=A0A1I4BE85_9ACTN|nr:single-stranded DNA-binding protein [Geodermatophilus ruber]SFK67122.1 single-strand DNA-binding protein [Geodermatophilus ruber]